MVCKMVPGDISKESAMVHADADQDASNGQDVRMAAIYFLDMTTASIQSGRTSLQLASTVMVKTLFDHASSTTSYVNGTFELTLQKTSGDVKLNDNLDKTLEAAGFICDNGNTRNSVIIGNLRSGPPVKDSPSGDKENLGQGIKPTCRNVNEATPLLAIGCSSSYKRGFVGLVNQAMTCYLNSLIQTLFMTPEFRNALYRWKFDGTEEEQAKSIPFQLQSLFLKLQTTDKPSIGTTNLTRSFGWDSSEAWQQHDIQELCRVMFDALEHKFKNTEQSDLISRLYEGKMMDYVRCLKCRTEKARDDTFLDIPLPVRPFGSQTAYPSVEEALKAFVAPETLDGNNQYWCDKCNDKCDAHKGLKFSRFPYLLTLHLKRFDFDYTTLHRIKLNDKVTFPEFLQLDSFLVDDHTCDPVAINKDSQDTAIEDSMSEASESSRANSSNDAESQDDDEGIDVRTEGCTSSSSASRANNATGDTNNRKNRGQYNYELFSIMIHSGSASGGHYYAYIKDFPTREWHCFNDQSVTTITYDDIRKTYGGGPSRTAGYFNSAYASSTNAYMLMYRAIDKERNTNFISPSEFPDHVQHLLRRMKEEEENQRVAEEQERNTCRLQLYCHHPKRGRIDTPFKIHKDVTLQQAISLAYDEINKLANIEVPLERCRLVKYNEFHDTIECSWDERLHEPVDDVFDGVRTAYKFELLLEIIAEGQTFQVYAPGSLNARVLLVDINARELNFPVTVRMPYNSTVNDLKNSIQATMNIAEDVEHIHLVTIRYSNEFHRLLDGERTLRSENFQRSEKVYAVVFQSKDDNDFLAHCKPRFHDLIDQYEHSVTVRLTLPKVDPTTLDRLGIDMFSSSVILPVAEAISSFSTSARPASPMESYSPDAGSDDSLSHLERERALSEGEDEDEAENRRRRQEDIEEFAAGSAHFHGSYIEGDEITAQPLPNSTSSTSEDSSSLSLTDSDRTLLGDAPETEEEILDRSFTEGEQCSGGGGGIRRRNALIQDEPELIESEVAAAPVQEKLKYFFKVIFSSDEDDEKRCNVMVDKRIPLTAFKSELESLLNVSSEFLLVYKKMFSAASPSSFGNGEREWNTPGETLESLGDDPQVIVRLGRALRPGEVRGKIYQLTINDSSERSKFLFEWVLSSGVQVKQMKRDIIAELNTRFGIDIPQEKCILRKKSWRTPSTVYSDEEEVLDTELMCILKNWEMYLQVLDLNDEHDVAAKYSDCSTAIFTRRWNPSTLTLGNFVDSPMSNLDRIELGRVLTTLSGLTAERIEIAKAPGTFPCDGSLLAIQDEITWVPLLSDDGSPTFKYPCSIQSDGDVVYWRDKDEPPKKLTEQERRDILRRENSDSGNSTTVTNTYTSSRKERPLRIFLDSPSTSVKQNQEPELD